MKLSRYYDRQRSIVRRSTATASVAWRMRGAVVQTVFGQAQHVRSRKRPLTLAAAALVSPIASIKKSSNTLSPVLTIVGMSGAGGAPTALDAAD